jgi:ectoine hydroxylase-related dioxygenase (phytanoyl-CoA dioxygenase family)
MISRIVPSGAERNAQSLTSETIEAASRNLRRDGALIMEDIIEPALIAEARLAFGHSYSRFLDGSAHEDALSVGDRRLMITIEMSAPFNDPQFFANPYLLPVLATALGDDFVIDGYGAVCSLPSAQAQHRHIDGAILYPDLAVDNLLPATAITVAMPLIAMNEVHGTTALWLGTHRDMDRNNILRDPNRKAERMDGAIEPVLREGSCVLWDFRLVHAGTANQSRVARPMLYLTYCRPWFFDQENFKPEKNPKQKRILATADFLASLPAQHRRLLARAWLS